MRSTRGFRIATLMALVILVPIGAGALRHQSRPFVEVVEQAEGLAIVRTTSVSVGPNTIFQTAGVEVVRTLIPSVEPPTLISTSRSGPFVRVVEQAEGMAFVRTTSASAGRNTNFQTVGVEVLRTIIPSTEPPTLVSASRIVEDGEEILASRFQGRWFELRSIVAGRVVSDPRTVSVPRLTAAIASLQAFFKETDEERRAQHLVQMLRSKDPLLKGAALDLLHYRPVVPTDEIYRLVIAMATCDGRFALPAIAQMVKFPVERTFETFQELVPCEQDTVARVAFRAIQGINSACPLEFEAVRSPTARGEAYRIFLECLDRRATKYSGKPPRRDVQ